MNKMLRNKRGFTMIEMVMVIVIAAILGVIAIPIYNDLQTNAKASNEAAVVGGVRGGIASSYVNSAQGGATPAYPGTLDGASVAACSETNACFGTVLGQGGVTAQWTKLSTSTYRSPVNGTNVWTYTAGAGTFTRTTA